MVGRACKLAGGLLPGVNKLPGRETAEEVYKLGVAVVYSNPSRATLPRPSVSDETGRVLPGRCAP